MKFICSNFFIYEGFICFIIYMWFRECTHIFNHVLLCPIMYLDFCDDYAKTFYVVNPKYFNTNVIRARIYSLDSLSFNWQPFQIAEAYVTILWVSIFIHCLFSRETLQNCFSIMMWRYVSSHQRDFLRSERSVMCMLQADVNSLRVCVYGERSVWVISNHASEMYFLRGIFMSSKGRMHGWELSLRVTSWIWRFTPPHLKIWNLPIRYPLS